MTHWMSEVPPKCQLSGKEIITEFVDGRVPGHSAWAIMHPDHFRSMGGRLGTGNGQRYEIQPDKQWLKVVG